jgi:hypothetical protein
MSSLTYSRSDSGLEVVILNNGQAFCTQSSYSRWQNIDRTTVTKRCQNLETIDINEFEGTVKKFTKLVKASIQHGIGKGSSQVILIPAKIMGRWLAKDNPELFDEMIDAGANQFLYRMAGYQIGIKDNQPVDLTDHQKFIIGTWEEERAKRKIHRRSFTDVIKAHCGHDERAYAKYTNMTYQFLLGTTADKLRSMPVINGIIQIGRNHIPEALQIHAVGRAEELAAYYYDGALSLGRKPSLTHSIWLACHEVKLALDLPQLGTSKSKATTQFKIISDRDSLKPSNEEIQHYLESLDKEFNF